MPQAKIEDTLSSYGLASNILSSQSILDVFILQNVINRDDADKLARNLKTNREIQNFLLQNSIVTQETVNKAYSILLKIPYISLRNVEIRKDVLEFIPAKYARKFGVIPFAVEDQTIRIAISRPADLVLGFKNGLAKVLGNTGYAVELFITGEDDFNSVVGQYDSKNKSNILLSRGSLPVVYLRNQPIADKYLKKLPRDFIAKNRLVVFGENQNGGFLIAAEKADAAITIKTLDFLEKENSIKIEVFATSKEDIDYCLDLYDGKKMIEKVAAQPVVAEQLPAPEEILQKAENKTDPQKGIFNFSNFWTTASSNNDPDNLTIDSIESDPNTPGESVQNIFLPPKIADLPQPTISQPVNSQSDTSQPANLPVLNNVPKQMTRISIQPEIAVGKEDPLQNIENVSKIEIEDNELADRDIGKLIPDDVHDIPALKSIIDESNVPKIVAAIINYALNNRASDIHVEPENKILRVRCRIDGILRDIAKMSLSLHPPFVSRVKILAGLKIDESRIPQDGRFDVSFLKREVDVRVSTLPTVHGEKVMMRILDKGQGILSLEDLGMQGSAFDLTVSTISRPHGIILSTGPTGSGKSTTLYAIINRINIPGINIVTLEDPVEYEIPGVNQCQVKPDIGFTFASGLRSVLRQDPNVIMVGEIRDSETANMSTHAALTGHLVLSTLHTNDSAGALPRLENMGVEPFLITSSINLIVAQRLVRRICPKCREEMKAPQKLYDEVLVELNKISPNNTKDRLRIPRELKLYYGKGCSECDQGYKGRIGIFEVLEMTPEIEDLAVDRKPASDIRSAAIRAGMITMRQDGIIKAFQGFTTIDEVFQAVTLES